MASEVGSRTQRLNLGCGEDTREEWINVDMIDLPGVDEQVNLETLPWPFADDAFTHVEAKHILEHLPEPVAAFAEIARVLKPKGGGVLGVSHRPPTLRGRHPSALLDGQHRQTTHRRARTRPRDGPAVYDQARNDRVAGRRRRTAGKVVRVVSSDGVWAGGVAFTGSRRVRRTRCGVTL